MRALIKKYALTVVGATVMAIALDLFLVPADIAPGGVSGIAIVLNHLVAFPVGVAIFALNIPIFVIAAIKFSRKFALNSLFGMFALSVITDILAFIEPVTEDLLLSAIYGGAVMGVGVGLVFRANTTTGGTEIVAHLLKKRFPELSMGRFVLILDVAVVVLAGLVYRKWEVMLYSAVAIYISSFIVDMIAEGGDFAKVAYIISDKPGKIAEEISARLGHGATALRGASLYTGKDKTVLMCVVKKYETTKLKEIIKEADSDAFVIVTEAREVLGNGFKRYI